jgi:hypothetical protein
MQHGFQGYLILWEQCRRVHIDDFEASDDNHATQTTCEKDYIVHMD